MFIRSTYIFRTIILRVMKFVYSFNIHLQNITQSAMKDAKGLRYDSRSQSEVRCQSFSRFRLFEAPWTVACQAPLSMGFPRQEYWNRLPFPSPRDLPSLDQTGSPTLQVYSLPSEPPGKSHSYSSCALPVCTFCLFLKGFTVCEINTSWLLHDMSLSWDQENLLFFSWFEFLECSWCSSSFP